MPGYSSSSCTLAALEHSTTMRDRGRRARLRSGCCHPRHDTLQIGLGMLGAIGSIFLVGYTIGPIGFGIAADKWGRKDTLGVAILLYGLTTMLGGLTENVVGILKRELVPPSDIQIYRNRDSVLPYGPIRYCSPSPGPTVAALGELDSVSRLLDESNWPPSSVA